MFAFGCDVLLVIYWLEEPSHRIRIPFPSRHEPVAQILRSHPAARSRPKAPQTNRDFVALCARKEVETGEPCLIIAY
jgi:hypothetical protein